jgi:hypothetical protein
VIQLFDNVIICNFPDEVKTVEHRSSPRTRFRPSDHKMVTISSEVDILTKAQSQNIFQVIDISAGGISVVCGENKISTLLSSHDVRLIRLGHLSMMVHTPLSMIYYQRFKYKQNGVVTKAFRVGYRFGTKIPKEMFQRFVTSTV